MIRAISFKSYPECLGQGGPDPVVKLLDEVVQFVRHLCFE